MLPPFYSDMDTRLYLGDVYDVLVELPDGEADACVTSPPYLDARPEYPSPTLTEWPAIFRELRRVVDGALLVNVGRLWRQGHELLWWSELIRLAERAGWPLRDTLVWCLSGGTRLYVRTPIGERVEMLKDLVRLDPATVELWNGERWTQVVSWRKNESPGHPLEIELRSGEKLRCTAEHLWPTQRGNVRADELVLGDTIAWTRLPEPDIPDDPRFLPDEEIGWLIGTYLAEGSRSGNTIQLSCHARELKSVHARANAVASALHGTAKAYRTGGEAATVNLNGPLTAALIQAYVHGTTAKTKRLTSRVWRRSNAFLEALLGAYLHGDGHYDPVNDRWRLGFTRNPRLASDMRTLAARLGLTIKIRNATSRIGDREYPTYRGEIRLDYRRPATSVTDVRLARGRGQYWDVEVADAPHLFALASGVLTHNCKPNANPIQGNVFTNAHEYVFLLGDGFDPDTVRTPYSPESLARYNRRFVANAGVKNYERPDHRPERVGAANELGARAKSYVEIHTGREKGNPHPAPMPLELAKHLVALSGGSCILDPFAGSGTTLIAARALSRQGIGIERDADYAKMAVERIGGQPIEQQSLLADAGGS